MGLDPRRYLKLPDDPRDVDATPRPAGAWSKMVANLESAGDSPDTARRIADNAGNKIEKRSR